jgi:hypothetical protein
MFNGHENSSVAARLADEKKLRHIRSWQNDSRFVCFERIFRWQAEILRSTGSKAKKRGRQLASHVF